MYSYDAGFRQLYEPLWMQYGVDILFSGHVHAYERTNPVHSYGVDSSGCAPTFVTIGDGGNHEGVSASVLTPYLISLSGVIHCTCLGMRQYHT